ncbi:MAG: hypothetical protein ABIG64_00820 [Candidatus Omnitrophota bacterium]
MKNLFFSFFTITIFLSTISLAETDAPEERFIYDDHQKRDPFGTLVTREGRILPGAKTEEQQENIELEGIMWDAQGRSLAILNKKLVKEGERVFNFQILKIKKDSVILQKEGKVKIINLKKEGE